MRADVRIRIRGGVIRIRIAEACIRTVIRITAEQDTTKNDQPILFYVITIYIKIFYNFGIKQRREPTVASVFEGAASECAQPKPAFAP